MTGAEPEMMGRVLARRSTVSESWTGANFPAVVVFARDVESGRLPSTSQRVHWRVLFCLRFWACFYFGGRVTGTMMCA